MVLEVNRMPVCRTLSSSLTAAVRAEGFACCCGGLGCPVVDRLRGLQDEWDLSTLACGWAVVRSRAQRVRWHLLTYEPRDGCMPDWLRGKDGQVVAAWSRNAGLGCAMLAAVRLGAKRDSRSRTRTATTPARSSKEPPSTSPEEQVVLPSDLLRLEEAHRPALLCAFGRT
ncbi:hypothetical protein D9Q98_002990 [Chlorella vulgaris]|uniref:Uncharacterized protein n=1 Tax=Chlorella vulgaris TaxID=3077 RepID=A0A9D4TUF8_CHLVU|nr:hypothetical protein D9Q98_002990 [Chlorella vulgaris]